MLTKSYSLTELRGVDIRVSILWVLVAGGLTVTLGQPETVTRYVTALSTLSTIGFTGELAQLSTPEFDTQVGQLLFGAALTTGIYLSVLLHEGGHIYVARFHGIQVNTVTLWALGGAAQMRSQPTSAWKEFSLTAAGPLVSSILAGGCLVGGVTIASQTTGIIPTWLLLVGLLNAGIASFNLLPAFPLDGGRIVRSVLTAIFEYQRATRYTTTVGIGLGVCGGIVSAVSVQLSGFVLSLFVCYVSYAERSRVLSQSPTAFTSPPVTVTPQAQSQSSDQQGHSVTLNTDSRVTEQSQPPSTGSPQHVSIENKEFVFRTSSQMPDGSVSTATDLLTQHGGTVSMNISSDTDYVIVPDNSVSLYQSRIESSEVTLLSTTVMRAVCQSLSE